MAGAREKLTRLIELASKDSVEDRRALARELCDLLLDWPANYPANMREPFEALLEKTLRVIDKDSCDALVKRIAESADAPLDLLNEFYFGAPDELRELILLRNAHANHEATHDPEPSDLDAASLGAQLVEVARTQARMEFGEALKALCGLNQTVVDRILLDATGESLAIVCKGAHLGRAAYSALAMLTGPSEQRLAAFDAVPQAGAEHLLKFWQSRETGQVAQRVA